ncbi:MAG: hypothetical protein NWE76_01160 [Candidatus Bathyarchaeota archaeon]|nr:hypothetical protein [Candidatus Bathyarchaeota archaeon]
MSQKEEYVRLNVEVPFELNERLNKLLPHGSKSEIVRALLRTLTRELEKPKRLIVIEALIKDCASITYNEKLANE